MYLHDREDESNRQIASPKNENNKYFEFKKWIL
jgi:hypothetical protein